MTDLPRSHADVRMKGFSQRITVEAAWSWVDRQATLRPSETIPLADCCGRVLAEDIVSPIDVPSFARSMMDGYALRSEDTLGSDAYNPLPLTIVGEVFPGRFFPDAVGPRQAVRIMTGAPLPRGADAVLPVEQTELQADRLLAQGAVSPGKHVGRVGEDITRGAKVLSIGRRLRPQDVGVLSSIGFSKVRVIARPTVRIALTGNELLPPGSAPREYQIIDSNGPMLSELVRRDGGVLTDASLIADSADHILTAMQEPADVVLISGGSSVGQEDFAPMLLAEHGELAIHGVAMRPSSPAGMGRLKDTLVFLLPGNPVSCLCAYDFFAGRALRQMGGRSSAWPHRRRTLPLQRKLVSAVGRVDYARVKIVDDCVEPLAISGASVLTSTVRADGFVIIPGDSEGCPEGTDVEVFLYDE